MALINSLGALGSFAGSYVVGYLNGTTGSFGASYIFMAGSLLLSAIITMIAVKGPGKPEIVEMEGSKPSNVSANLSLE
jgi:hypothetical protein